MRRNCRRILAKIRFAKLGVFFRSGESAARGVPLRAEKDFNFPRICEIEFRKNLPRFDFARNRARALRTAGRTRKSF